MDPEDQIKLHPLSVASIFLALSSPLKFKPWYMSISYTQCVFGVDIVIYVGNHLVYQAVFQYLKTEEVNHNVLPIAPAWGIPIKERADMAG
jgi:hypothetical protein